MFDWIPIYSYVPIYYNLVLITVLITSAKYFTTSNPRVLIPYNENSNLLFFVFVVFWMGLRPYHWIFIDMMNYGGFFDDMALGKKLEIKEEILFWGGMNFLAQFVSKTTFFFICSLLYILPLWFSCKRIFSKYAFIAFLFCVGSFSFWTYGVNGIRNGIAGSLVILGFSYADRKVIMGLLFLAAINIHKSELLPIAAFVLTFFYNNPTKYLIGWLLSIVLSFGVGGSFETFFSGFMEDDRLTGYLTADSETGYIVEGFRWDFLLYSSWPIAVGAYFIFKKKYVDQLFYQLFNAYVVANAFWVLVMRASFSNRFAYLSWFMMSFVLVYPYLKAQFWKQQNIYIIYMLLAYFGFTYFMNVLI